jgi:hypothetical protein
VGGVVSRSSEGGADAVGWSVGTGGVLAGGCVVADAVGVGMDGSEEGVVGGLLGVADGVSGVVAGGVAGMSTTGTIPSPFCVGAGSCVGAVRGVVLVGVGEALGVFLGFGDALAVA